MTVFDDTPSTRITHQHNKIVSHNRLQMGPVYVYIGLPTHTRIG